MINNKQEQDAVMSVDNRWLCHPLTALTHSPLLKAFNLVPKIKSK